MKTPVRVCLMVQAFEGNAAETTTMVPTLRAFMKAHSLSDVTIVADAGMFSGREQEGHQGRRTLVHPRRPHTPGARPRRPMAARTP